MPSTLGWVAEAIFSTGICIVNTRKSNGVFSQQERHHEPSHFLMAGEVFSELRYTACSSVSTPSVQSVGCTRGCIGVCTLVGVHRPVKARTPASVSHSQEGLSKA